MPASEGQGRLRALGAVLHSLQELGRAGLAGAWPGVLLLLVPKATEFLSNRTGRRVRSAF